MLPRIGIALLLFVAGAALAGEVYTWKDANGRTHFSDKPLNQAARALTVTPPPVAPRQAIDLTGTWQSQGDKDGRSVLATVTFKADQSFAGKVQLDGQDFMTTEGQWRIDGDQLLWTYTQTSIPLPDSLKKDSDTILSASAEHLELQSALSGEVRLFSRVAPAAAKRDG
ncbi:DUF4124 domain-containing protein [Pseudomonas sp. GCM10022188]|uniref:DUF4124 domain-containing protein n=1 Tax=Pseudomonas TaxID=286 RepID=UPI001E4139ED|nr:DUF4124 domain-containing protein [Pseudomonas oryzagri]MCC6075803.1 DUF4124 domain-containing protein [Pseudomonas oryzagri]